MPSVLKNRFNEAVRRIMADRGLTQADLCRAIYGTVDANSRVQVSRVINGSHTPSFEVVERFAQALELDPADLLMAAEKIPA